MNKILHATRVILMNKKDQSVGNTIHTDWSFSFVPLTYNFCFDFLLFLFIISFILAVSLLCLTVIPYTRNMLFSVFRLSHRPPLNRSAFPAVRRLHCASHPAGHTLSLRRTPQYKDCSLQYCRLWQSGLPEYLRLLR